MEQYNSIQQLLKKEGGKKNPVFPPTVVQAVFDAKTGASLEAILAQFNSVYLQYQGSPKATRLIIPKEMRRAGLTITYMNMEGETITERASSAVQKDNDHWGLDINWSRVDELSLSGNISVSAKGTWIINGHDTGVKAVGPKGDAGLTPWLKTIDNRLHLSYDNVTWEPCSDPIAAYFRWSSNKIQISRDNKTWTDLSGTFADNLHIKGYVATTSALPSSAAQGDIYGVGPTYAAEDTARTNPIYRYYVRNANTWVDNGAFTSIAAGIAQETGDSENVVMSQKAVTEKLSELGSEVQKSFLKPLAQNPNFKIGETINGLTGKVIYGENHSSIRYRVKKGYVVYCTDAHILEFLNVNEIGDIPTILETYTKSGYRFAEAVTDGFIYISLLNENISDFEAEYYTGCLSDNLTLGDWYSLAYNPLKNILYDNGAEISSTESKFLSNLLYVDIHAKYDDIEYLRLVYLQNRPSVTGDTVSFYINDSKYVIALRHIETKNGIVVLASDCIEANVTMYITEAYYNYIYGKRYNLINDGALKFYTTSKEYKNRGFSLSDLTSDEITVYQGIISIDAYSDDNTPLRLIYAQNRSNVMLGLNEVLSFEVGDSQVYIPLTYDKKDTIVSLYGEYGGCRIYAKYDLTYLSQGSALNLMKSRNIIVNPIVKTTAAERPKGFKNGRLAVIGDSIGDGSTTTNKKYQFRTVLSNMLGMTCNYNTTHGSWCYGNPSASVLPEMVSLGYKALYTLLPDNLEGDERLIIMEAGTNDHAESIPVGVPYIEEDYVWNGKTRKRRVPSYDLDTTCGGMNEAIRRIYEKLGHVNIVVMLPLKKNFYTQTIWFDTPISDMKNYAGLYQNDYEDAIRKVAELWGLPVITTNQMDMNPTNNTVWKRMFNEGIHPNDAGHYKVANVLYKYIVNNVFVGGVISGVVKNSNGDAVVGAVVSIMGNENENLNKHSGYTVTTDNNGCFVVCDLPFTISYNIYVNDALVRKTTMTGRNEALELII